MAVVVVVLVCEKNARFIINSHQCRIFPKKSWHDTIRSPISSMHEFFWLCVIDGRLVSIIQYNHSHNYNGSQGSSFQARKNLNKRFLTLAEYFSVKVKRKRKCGSNNNVVKTDKQPGVNENKKQHNSPLSSSWMAACTIHSCLLINR